MKSFGVKLEEARQMIDELIATEDDDLLVVSHGIYNDRQTLLNNGIDLYINKNKRDTGYLHL